MGQAKRGVLWTIDREELQQIVSESVSVSEILRKLNLFHYEYSRVFWKRVAQDNITTDHIKRGKGQNSGGKYHRTPKTIDEIFADNSGVSRNYLRQTVLNKKLVPYQCQICGQLPERRGRELLLILDHINGKSQDNRLENLRFLCPNCNSQTDTFCSIKDSRSY